MSSKSALHIAHTERNSAPVGCMALINFKKRNSHDIQISPLARNMANNFVMQIVFLFVLLTKCSSQMATSQYVAYVNYSAVDFDSQPAIVSPDVGYCVAQSNVRVDTNGVMYNAALLKCVVLTAANNDIVVTLHQNAGWTVYVKDISNVLKLIVKYQNAIIADSVVANANDIWYGVGTSYTSTYSNAVSSVNVSSACNCNYRNAYLSSSSWNVSAVSLAVATR